MLEQIDNWIMGLSKFELGLLIYFYILFAIWVWKSDEKQKPSDLDAKDKPDPKPFTSPPVRPEEKFELGKPSIFRPQKKYQLTVNKKRFVLEVIRWGLRNIPYDGIGKKIKSVNFEISYYKHKKNYGVFYSSNKTIKVFVNNHNKIDEFIDTILHEVVHFFQYSADKRNFQTKYKLLLNQFTYVHHPMEIEARKIASQYVNPCFDYLIENGYLTKAA